MLDWRDPAVKRFFVLMLPVTLTLGLINVNIFVNMLFASRLVDPELAPTAIEKAFRVYMLPQGMFSVAVVTVLFPTLSRFAAVGNLPSFRATLDSGLRQIAFLLLPAGAVSAVLAQPIVRLLYERGAFTADNTVVVAQCLAAFSLGLMFNGWMLLLSRGFYSLQRNWVPTTIALGTVGLNAVLDAILYRVGVWGIPLATSLVNIVGVGAAPLVMRQQPGARGAAPRRRLRPPHPPRLGGRGAASPSVLWWLLDDAAREGALGPDPLARMRPWRRGAALPGAARLLGVRELEALRALPGLAKSAQEATIAALDLTGLGDALLACPRGELALERLELSAERPARGGGRPARGSGAAAARGGTCRGRGPRRRRRSGIAAVADADLDLGERVPPGPRAVRPRCHS